MTQQLKIGLLLFLLCFVLVLVLVLVPCCLLLVFQGCSYEKSFRNP